MNYLLCKDVRDYGCIILLEGGHGSWTDELQINHMKWAMKKYQKFWSKNSSFLSSHSLALF